MACRKSEGDMQNAILKARGAIPQVAGAAPSCKGVRKGGRDIPLLLQRWPSMDCRVGHRSASSNWAGAETARCKFETTCTQGRNRSAHWPGDSLLTLKDLCLLSTYWQSLGTHLSSSYLLPAIILQHLALSLLFVYETSTSTEKIKLFRKLSAEAAAFLESVPCEQEEET